MKFEEKHRPKTLDDIIFVDAYVERIVKETAANKRHKHLILHGPRGAGKSETANLIMKSRYAEEDVNIAKCSVHASALEDKSLGILTGNWNYQRAFGMLHGCLVIEEVDQLKPGMQQTLRAIVDEHTFGIIICTTNNLHRIDQPLQDRCRCLEFTYPTVDQWLPRAKAILDTNGIFFTEVQTQLLLKGFEGSGRKMMDWLEDTILDFTSDKSEFDQLLEARTRS